MSKFYKQTLLLAAIALGALTIQSAAQDKQGPRYNIGKPATAEQIKGWDIDVRGDDGQGLPAGKGSVAEGAKLYLQSCASCHGEFGEGNGRWPELMGGKGSLASEDPRKTIGSFWPYAPTVFDYVRRAMPFTAPQSLSDDEVYAITAYLLNLNDLLPDDGVLDAARLRAIRMPNREHFLQGDPRPDVAIAGPPCMKNCRKGPIAVTSDLAARLGVTPERPKD
jgi:mono/diheme cytochrome c family protein